MSMEYRAFVTVPGLPFSQDAKWEPFIEALESVHGDLGPVLSWERGEATVMLATDAAEGAEAASTVVRAVADGLLAAGLGGHYPSNVALERDAEPVVLA